MNLEEYVHLGIGFSHVSAFGFTIWLIFMVVLNIPCFVSFSK